MDIWACLLLLPALWRGDDCLDTEKRAGVSDQGTKGSRDPYTMRRGGHFVDVTSYSSIGLWH